MRKNAVSKWFVTVWMIVLPLCLAAGPVDICRGQGVKQPEASSLYANMQKLVEDSTAAETETVQQLTEQLDLLQRLRSDWQAQLKAYSIKVTTYSGFLLLPKDQIKELDKTWNEVRDTIAAINGKLNQIQHAAVDIDRQIVENRQQIDFRSKQLNDIEAVALKDDEAAPLIKLLKGLLARLTTKENLLGSIQGLYAAQLSELTVIANDVNGLSRKFEQAFREKQQPQLFTREKKPPFTSGPQRIAAECRLMVQAIGGAFSADFWANEFREVWNSAGFLVVSLLIVLAVMVWGLTRLRTHLAKLSESSFCKRFSANRLFCVLAGRTLLLTGATVYLHICNQIDVLYFSTPSLKFFFVVFLVWLLTKWGNDALKNWEQLAGKPMPAAINRRLRSLLASIRSFALAYAFLSWFFMPPSALLSLTRFVFELLFIGFIISLSRVYSADPVETDKEPAKKRFRLRTFVLAVLQVITVGGLVLDLAGFGNLTIYWFSSWGQSAAVWLWWYIFFRMLVEWDTSYREKMAQVENPSKISDTVQWLMIRMGQLLWGTSLITLMLLIWGEKSTVLVNVIEFLGSTIQIGSMAFSFLSLLYAVLVLFLTHALASMWRHIFQTRFLKHSGLESGLQDSITTITAYVAWSLGILVALHVFGLNTASLAVAFGALGIGIGFGLQNIVNNFISGIILLFERPIQVGDDVEINGTWATVKKINVRSTVVQTYDNASLIIPNSEFISNQVINWSFKDKRLRRTIVVGVAYGSDIELVRQTFLEIAGSIRHALKYPKPDVIFSDFGDSALIFKLRLWTDITHIFEVETAVRFEIDRLFRERKIEIAFPQQDLHIRSMPETITRPIPPQGS